MEIFSALLAFCAGNTPVPVNSPHKGQWRGALMFSLICAWANSWVNNRDAGDLRRHHAHYDVTVMISVAASYLHLQCRTENCRLVTSFSLKVYRMYREIVSMIFYYFNDQRNIRQCSWYINVRQVVCIIFYYFIRETLVNAAGLLAKTLQCHMWSLYPCNELWRLYIGFTPLSVYMCVRHVSPHTPCLHCNIGGWCY